MFTFGLTLLWWVAGLLGAYWFLVEIRRIAPVDRGDVTIAFGFSLLGPLFILMNIIVFWITPSVAGAIERSSFGQGIADWMNK